MAHKKGQGSTQNGRDSNPQYRGVKAYGGQRVTSGSIIVRQVGTKFKAGRNVRRANDDSLFAVAEGETLTFDKVCLVGGEGAGRIGTPFVNGASVVAKVVRQVKGPKVITGKFRRRKNSRRRRGFRAQYTVVQIESIQG